MGAAIDQTTCPDENALVGLIEGRLSEERVSTLESHIDSCVSCTSMMHELAEVIAPETERAPRGGDFVIGRYEVLEEIGAGGMGVVYSAYDPELRRKVALKLLRPDIEHITDVSAARARLLREARLLATLSHPNVVTVYDVGTMGDDIFIAVELIEGRSLAEWMAEERPTWREVAKIYVQAARGLLAAHDAGLIHRDIKPANLLLGTDGGVRVTDFGLATAAGSATGPSGVRKSSRADTSLLTQTGAVVGTPAYMAPEQYAGRGADERSDQFSFCVSLAEAFIGDRPTAGATADDLVEVATEHERKPPPRPLLEVVARGLCARAADRHDDMAAVASALEHALDGEAERLLAASDTDSDTEPPPARPRSDSRSSNLGWLMAIGLSGALVYAFMRDRAPAPTHDASNSAVPSETVVVADPSVTATADTSAAALPEMLDAGAVITSPGVVSSTAPGGVRNADSAFLGASQHHDSGEGAQCLTKLGEGGRLDPKRAASGHYQRMRAQCRMMTGDCAGGRKLLRGLMGTTKKGAELETALDAQSIPACRRRPATVMTSKSGQAKIGDLQALQAEAQAAHEAKDTAKCRAVGAKIDAYVAKHNLGSEPQLKHVANSASSTVTDCLAKNNDCAAARASWAKKYRTLYPELMSPEEYNKNLEPMFYSSYPHCKGK